MMPGLALGLGTVLALASAAPVQTATTELPVAIEYRAPYSCGDRAAFVADVERLAGAQVVHEGSARAVSVQLRQVPAGFELTLTRAAADGTMVEARTIEDEDCETLVRAAALVVAVNEEPVSTSRRVSMPEEVAEPPSPADTSSSERAAPTAAPRFEPPQAAPSATDTTRLHLDVLLRGGLGLGLTPSPTGTLGGGVRLGGQRLDIEVSASHAFATELAITPGIGIRAASTSGTLIAAWHREVGPLEVRLGAGVRAGGLHGSGIGGRVVARSTGGAWWGIPIVAGASWSVSPRFALHAQVEAIGVILRPAIGLRTPSGEAGPAVRLRRGALIATMGPRIRVF